MKLRWSPKRSVRTDPASLQITLPALAEIGRTVGALPAEHGGVLGGKGLLGHGGFSYVVG